MQNKSSEIVVATANRNKIAELKAVGSRHNLNILSPKEVQVKYELGEIPEVEETASDYRGNAFLKAEAFSRWSALPAIGDDSGLEVFALDGMPGIYSARYAGHAASDEEKINKLLLELSDKLKTNPSLGRKARFYSYLLIYFPSGQIIESDGELQGEILENPRGNLGYGYDPIVHIYELGKTLAEVDFSVTCKKGFRAKAAEKIFKKFKILA